MRFRALLLISEQSLRASWKYYKSGHKCFADTLKHINHHTAGIRMAEVASGIRETGVNWQAQLRRQMPLSAPSFQSSSDTSMPSAMSSLHSNVDSRYRLEYFPELLTYSKYSNSPPLPKDPGIVGHNKGARGQKRLSRLQVCQILTGKAVQEEHINPTAATET